MQVCDVHGFLCLVLWKSTSRRYYFPPAPRPSILAVISYVLSYLDSLVSSGDERDKQRQHHVDEEGDEGVQVHLAEQPHQSAALLHLRERHKHVVPVDEGEEALGHHGQRTELRDTEQQSGFCKLKSVSNAVGFSGRRSKCGQEKTTS